MFLPPTDKARRGFNSRISLAEKIHAGGETPLSCGAGVNNSGVVVAYVALINYLCCQEERHNV